jgi:anti-sigma regulatory factor (Ser/Thr protein kinase)
MEALIVPGTLDSLVLIRQYVKQAAAQAGLDRKRSYRLQLAVDEIATNIVNHGYREAGREGDVLVRATLDAKALTVVLEDTAVPFDPRHAARPEQISLPLAARPVGGLGIFLAMEGVDRFDYEFTDGRNRNIFQVNRVAVTAERVGEMDGM